MTWAWVPSSEPEKIVGIVGGDIKIVDAKLWEQLTARFLIDIRPLIQDVNEPIEVACRVLCVVSNWSYEMTINRWILSWEDITSVKWSCNRHDLVECWIKWHRKYSRVRDVHVVTDPNSIVDKHYRVTWKINFKFMIYLLGNKNLLLAYAIVHRVTKINNFAKCVIFDDYSSKNSSEMKPSSVFAPLKYSA
jgi:hypothetical protein